MKKSIYGFYIVLIFSIFLISITLTDCKKTSNPIVYTRGTFPDSAFNMAHLNSAYDDYNLSLYQINGTSPVVFSSNRKSSGGQFDLVQGNFSFTFDQTNGAFELGSEVTNDAFLDKLINKAQTAGNDFGPYRLYSSVDGYEYLILASVNTAGNLDLFYLKNRPTSGTSLPEVYGPYPIKLLNTSSDDAYISFDTNQDSAYFCTNKDGNFDIFIQKRPAEKDLSSWFNLDYSASSIVDSINSAGDDKCPYVLKKVMVFASNRPGGLGGYDLYYSIFKKGKWSSPVNLGPGVNTSSDEYRPVLGQHEDYTNMFMMFSSNRPGGKGGFDLYFKGVEFASK
jgi:hypothetical protein